METFQVFKNFWTRFVYVSWRLGDPLLTCSRRVAMREWSKASQKNFRSREDTSVNNTGGQSTLVDSVASCLIFLKRMYYFLLIENSLKVYFSPLIGSSVKKFLFTPHYWVQLSNNGIQINVYMSDPVIWQLILVLYSQRTLIFPFKTRIYKKHILCIKLFLKVKLWMFE